MSYQGFETKKMRQGYVIQAIEMPDWGDLELGN